MTVPTSAAQARTIGDWYVKARNEANLSLLDTIYRPDVTVHDPGMPQEIRGLAALKSQYANTHAAVPDLRFSLDELYVSGDRVAWVFTMSGTVTRPFRSPVGELPPTGKHFRLSGVAVDRLVDGMIAEEWLYYNLLELLVALGFVLAPPQFAPQPALG